MPAAVNCHNPDLIACGRSVDKIIAVSRPSCAGVFPDEVRRVERRIAAVNPPLNR